VQFSHMSSSTLCPSQDSFPVEEIKYRPICKCSRLQHLICLVFPFLDPCMHGPRRSVSAFWRNLGVKSSSEDLKMPANSVTAQMCIEETFPHLNIPYFFLNECFARLGFSTHVSVCVTAPPLE